MNQTTADCAPAGGTAGRLIVPEFNEPCPALLEQWMTDGSLFVGDPWFEAGDAHPEGLDRNNRFVSHNLREYSNAAERSGLREGADFVAFMLSHGLSGVTVGITLKQLAAEALFRRPLGWRRVAIFIKPFTESC